MEAESKPKVIRPAGMTRQEFRQKLRTKESKIPTRRQAKGEQILFYNPKAKDADGNRLDPNKTYILG